MVTRPKFLRILLLLGHVNHWPRLWVKLGVCYVDIAVMVTMRCPTAIER